MGNRSAVEQGYALSESCYAFGYRLRQKYGRLHEAAIKWFAPACSSLLQAENPAVLSLGCGNGAFDIDLIQIMQEQGYRPDYAGIDFNRQDLDDFRFRLEQKLPGLSPLAVLRHDKFDHTSRLEKTYDLITMVHFLHSFDEALPVIQAARGHLKAQGRLLIIQTSRHGIYQVKKEFCDILPNNRFMSSERIKEALEGASIDYDSEKIETFLDLSLLEKRSMEGLLLMSFCLGNDLTLLETAQQEAIRQAFLSHVRRNKTGQLLFPECLDVITVRAPASVPV